MVNIPTAMCNWNRVSVKGQGSITVRRNVLWLAAHCSYDSCWHCSGEKEGNCERQIWGTVRKTWTESKSVFIEAFNIRRLFYYLNTLCRTKLFWTLDLQDHLSPGNHDTPPGTNPTSYNGKHLVNRGTNEEFVCWYTSKEGKMSSWVKYLLLY